MPSEGRPHQQQQVILLVGLEGVRYEQVAQILTIPPAAPWLHNHLYRQAPLNS